MFMVVQSLFYLCTVYFVFFVFFSKLLLYILFSLSQLLARLLCLLVQVARFSLFQFLLTWRETLHLILIFT